MMLKPLFLKHFLEINVQFFLEIIDLQSSIVMKKAVFLQSSPKLSQLEDRVAKTGYLSKGSLPACADAKVFLSWEDQNKIPNRSSHPNLYFWYITMRQFATKTLKLWQQQDSFADEDKCIDEYIFFESISGEKEREATSRLKSSENKETQVFSETTSKYLHCLPVDDNRNSQVHQMMKKIPISLGEVSSEALVADSRDREDLVSLAIKKEYVMELRLETESNTSIRELRERLQKLSIELVSIEGQEENVRVVFKTEAQEEEKIKDKISKWQEVSNLQFRKQKKANSRMQQKVEKTAPTVQHPAATHN